MAENLVENILGNMLSAIAIVKIAVEICNSPELKKEILYTSHTISEKSDEQERKKQWNETVEIKARTILKNVGLPEKLQEKVMAIVPLVGMRMLTWAEYHEGTLGFSREYSIEFLNSSFFTQQGIIDNKKAADELMNDKHLSIEQEYKLACIYCFTDHILALYRQMTKEEQEKFCSNRPQLIKQPESARSYYLMVGRVDKIEGQSVDQYRLEKSVKSGSKAAVEYCLERTNLRKKDAVVDAAVEAVRNRILAMEDDCIVFRNQRYDYSKGLWWVPCDYYIDILCFLLSKMGDDDQIEFLKKDIEGVKYKIQPFAKNRRSRVLEYFLSWPYQAYFMKTAELMWEFLPESAYAILLLKVCDKIESEKQKNFKYCEENIYDYRRLLKEFWIQSPERYKRYLFSNQIDVSDIYSERAEIVQLLIKLLTLQNFTREDKENIKLILASATDNENKNIICSKEGKNICIGLMKEEKWKILDLFVLNCFSSKDQANEFKRELIFTKEAQSVCIGFVKNYKWNTAASLIKWCSLPEEEINQFKKEIVYSKDGKQACLSLIQCDKLGEDIDRFIRWHFSSEEEVKTFEKELIFCDSGAYKCADLVLEDKLDVVSEFINFCLSSEKEIRELKKRVAYKTGSVVFEEYSIENIYDKNGCYKCATKFQGGKWEEVEKILTWCFSSEEEIRQFKKGALLELSGMEIHFNLIQYNQFAEAETFFAWLGLSVDEIQKLKKNTLFSYDAASDLMYSELMFREDGDEEFVDYGNKQEPIELLLRWFLTDKETVLEFKDAFKDQYYGEITEERKAVFENLIEQRLKDLDEEKRG